MLPLKVVLVLSPPSVSVSGLADELVTIPPVVNESPANEPMVVEYPARSTAPAEPTTRAVLAGSAPATPILSRPPFTVVAPAYVFQVGTAVEPPKVRFWPVTPASSAVLSVTTPVLVLMLETVVPAATPAPETLAPTTTKLLATCAGVRVRVVELAAPAVGA